MKNFIAKVKGHGKALAVSGVATCLTVASVVTPSAATPDLSSTFSQSISSIQSDVLGYIAVALPVGLAIFGAIIAIKKGISFVRSLIGK